jgi:transposase
VRDWLPADHVAWFVSDVVDQLDLGPFLKTYRADGHGRAAYEPRMLLAVLLICGGIPGQLGMCLLELFLC